MSVQGFQRTCRECPMLISKAIIPVSRVTANLNLRRLPLLTMRFYHTLPALYQAYIPIFRGQIALGKGTRSVLV